MSPEETAGGARATVPSGEVCVELAAPGRQKMKLLFWQLRGLMSALIGQGRHRGPQTRQDSGLGGAASLLSVIVDSGWL